MSTTIFPIGSETAEHVNGLSVTSFFGGIQRGICLQFSMHQGREYAQLTRDDVEQLKAAIDDWLVNNPFKPQRGAL